MGKIKQTGGLASLKCFLCINNKRNYFTNDKSYV